MALAAVVGGGAAVATTAAAMAATASLPLMFINASSDYRVKIIYIFIFAAQCELIIFGHNKYQKDNIRVE